MPVVAKPILPLIAKDKDAERRIARFWPKVDRRGPDECWPWQAGMDGSGYGRFRIGYTKVPAHRFAWVITHGVDPAWYEHMMHSCDNRPCCNPAHLRPGTQSENIQDMMAKGRGRYPPKAKPSANGACPLCGHCPPKL